MLADPIRLAFRPPGSLDAPNPLDRGPALGPDEAIPIPGEITFDEVLQGRGDRSDFRPPSQDDFADLEVARPTA